MSFSEPIVIVGFGVWNFIEHPEEIFAVAAFGQGFQPIEGEQLFRERGGDYLIDRNMLRFGKSFRLFVKLVRDIDGCVYFAVRSR